MREGKKEAKMPGKVRLHEMGGGAESWVETRPHVRGRGHRCQRGRRGLEGGNWSTRRASRRHWSLSQRRGNAPLSRPEVALSQASTESIHLAEYVLFVRGEHFVPSVRQAHYARRRHASFERLRLCLGCNRSPGFECRSFD